MPKHIHFSTTNQEEKLWINVLTFESPHRYEAQV